MDVTLYNLKYWQGNLYVKGVKGLEANKNWEMSRFTEELMKDVQKLLSKGHRLI